MKAIVAVDLNWGIGFQGNLLQHIPEDMNFFKEKTIGNVVVMGRETFDSLPGKKPLSDRINIVLSRNKLFNDSRIIICNSIEQILVKLNEYDKEVFIIGGESIYKEFLPYCNEIYLTKIYNEYKADRFFPNIDKDNNWILECIGEINEYNDIKYNFLKYKRLYQ